MSSFSCKCGEILVKSVSETEHKLRGKVLLVKDGKTYAVCKGCNTEVQLPVSVTVTVQPKLILKK